MSSKQELLRGETNVRRASMYGRTCLCIEYLNGTLVYKEDLMGRVYTLDGHDGKIIIAQPDGSFLFHPYQRYMLPGVNHRFHDYYRARFGDHANAVFYRHSGNLKLSVANMRYGHSVTGTDIWPNYKVFHVPDNGIVYFDGQGLPQGLKEYVYGERKNGTAKKYESTW